MNLRIDTERVYAIGYDDNVITRAEAKIIVDTAHHFEHLDDVGGIIPVESGLTARDVAVFMSFFGCPEGEDIPKDVLVGYMVGSVNDIDGSGTLIHEDMIDRQPSSTVSKEMLAKLQFLDAVDEDALEGDFSLQGLAAYVKRHRKSSHSPTF
jgi:hypothetical protein